MMAMDLRDYLLKNGHDADTFARSLNVHEHDLMQWVENTGGIPDVVYDPLAYLVSGRITLWQCRDWIARNKKAMRRKKIELMAVILFFAVLPLIAYLYPLLRKWVLHF